ncbi:MAG TPA: hypothetical protein VMC84_06355 [Methanocella sp.]|uniref:hypothetical protein n=1 Tax=Methanocella sp. TaxID=2052833 RepID=UPI002B8C3CF1|nr:hypothetical protein [Methanocella sp.]HTY90782.1 hypothetical protein [Methanocella sp.]
MDRKALAITILLLSSFVVLLLINQNQPATAPAVSPSATPAANAGKPVIAMLNTSDIVPGPVNITATPSPAPTNVIHRKPAAPPSPTPSHAPSPTTSAAMEPWKPMPAWSPMPEASPLSWTDTLWKNASK